MDGLLRGKLVEQKVTQLVHEFGRGHRGAVEGDPCLGRQPHQVQIDLVVVGQENAGDVELNQVLKRLAAGLGREVDQIPGLGIAQNLHALIGKEFDEARQRHAGPVEVALGHQALRRIDLVEGLDLYAMNATVIDSFRKILGLRSIAPMSIDECGLTNVEFRTIPSTHSTRAEGD